MEARVLSNSLRGFILLAAALLLVPTQVLSQVYTVTNFTTGYFNTNDGYEPVFSLDGQPYFPTNPTAWATTDPEQPSVGGTNIGSTSIVQPYAFYTFGDTSTNGNNSVLFGGFNSILPTPAKLVPGTTNPSLYVADFAPSPEAALSTTFSADFAIRRPAGPQGVYTNRDSFGFTLWQTFGVSQIAQFAFNGSSPTVAAGTTNYGFQWFDSSNVWQSNNPSLTATNWQIALESMYRLNVVLSNDGTFSANVQTLLGQLDAFDQVTNYAVVSTTPFVNSGSLGGFTPDDLNALSIDWSLTSGDPNLPGANFMVLNQASVTSVVPEPSTIALLLLAFSGLAFSLVRRARLLKSPVSD